METEIPQMQKPYMNSEITQLTDILKNIALKYPQIEPTVFVWDFKLNNFLFLFIFLSNSIFFIISDDLSYLYVVFSGSIKFFLKPFKVSLIFLSS